MKTAPTIIPATSDTHWRQAIGVLHRVYVGEGYSAPERAASAYRREALEPEGEAFLALDEDGTVIGVVLFLQAESTLRQVALPGEREFRLLAVDPNARGKGAGAALVQACMARSRAAGAAALVLWTRPTMLSAQRLYERLGFRRVPERDTDDARGFRRLVYRFTTFGQPGAW